MPNLGKNQRFFVLRDLQIWRMTLKNNRALLLCSFKLCASFHSHLSIQNGVTVRKRQIWVKIGDFLSRVTLIFDGWPWKTIGHLFYRVATNTPRKISMIFQWHFKTKFPNFHDNSECHKTKTQDHMLCMASSHTLCQLLGAFKKIGENLSAWFDE